MFYVYIRARKQKELFESGPPPLLGNSGSSCTYLQNYPGQEKIEIPSMVDPLVPSTFRGMGRLEQCQGLHCWFDSACK